MILPGRGSGTLVSDDGVWCSRGHIVDGIRIFDGTVMVMMMVVGGAGCCWEW